MNEPGFFSSKEDLMQIHNTSMRILSELGIVINHSGMRNRLADRGCRVDGVEFLCHLRLCRPL